MKLVATADYLMDLGSGTEVVKRGQEFTPQPSFQASAAEQRGYLLRQKVGVEPKDWPAYRDRTEAKWQAAQKLVAAANAERKGGHAQ